MKNDKIFLRAFQVIFFILLFCLPELSEAFDDSITVSNSPGLSIPDNCTWVEDNVWTNVANQEAVVLTVDISITFSHPYPTDLIAILQYGDDTTFRETFWDISQSTYIRNGIATFFPLKARTQWKLMIADCDPIGSGTLVSWTLKVRYHIPPDPPASVWASTGWGSREIDLLWLRSYDDQCIGYRLEGNRNKDTLTDYNVEEVGRSVFPCAANAKTVDGLACVDRYYFRVRTISNYNVLGPPSFPLAETLSSYCQNVDVGGTLKYVNYDDKYAGYSFYPDTIPVKNALVTFWDASGDSFAVPPMYTNSDGYFGTFLVFVNEPICAKFQLVDQDSSIRVYNYDSSSIEYTFSDTMGPDNYMHVIKNEESQQEQDTAFARACYGFDYLARTKYFFQCLPPSPWDTPPVQVQYDYNDLNGPAFSYFDSLGQRYLIHLTSMGAPNFAYRLDVPVHEYAHLIHLKAWNINSFHTTGCPSLHSPDTRSSPACAFDEGWAEFLSCVPYTLSTDRKAWYLKYNFRDLEDNNWWAGPDGRNTNGSFVEGAVASAWYDMEDLNIDYPDERSGTEYYELSYEMSKIFDIFRNQKPQTITDFMDYWQNYPGLETWEKERLIKIFAQHHIFKPGDANSDGLVTVADVVFLVNYLFKGGPPPDPRWRGDANGDCNVNIADTVYLVAFLFKQGPKPFFNQNPNCWP